MSSAPIRDPFADHLITPQNSALVLIDYQSSQFPSLRSMDSGQLLKNIVELLGGSPPIDRTTVNSWEDLAFLAAVRAAGRRKLIFCALWTEVCMAFTALDALRDGYEVYPVVDAVGGTSVEAHRAGLERVVQAGGQPISGVSLACELQRDWARQETVADIVQIVLTDRLLQE
jgi:nicotinamidase-related amidase